VQEKEKHSSSSSSFSSAREEIEGKAKSLLINSSTWITRRDGKGKDDVDSGFMTADLTRRGLTQKGNICERED